MRKDTKYNRLTWHRKEKIGKHHPRYIKDMVRELLEEPEEEIDEEEVVE